MCYTCPTLAHTPGWIQKVSQGTRKSNPHCRGGKASLKTIEMVTDSDSCSHRCVTLQHGWMWTALLKCNAARCCTHSPCLPYGQPAISVAHMQDQQNIPAGIVPPPQTAGPTTTKPRLYALSFFPPVDPPLIWRSPFFCLSSPTHLAKVSDLLISITLMKPRSNRRLSSSNLERGAAKSEEGGRTPLWLNWGSTMAAM